MANLDPSFLNEVEVGFRSKLNKIIYTHWSLSLDIQHNVGFLDDAKTTLCSNKFKDTC